MGKIGYNIWEAAKATGASERDISLAVRAGTLKGHVVRDDCIILRADLREWVAAQPDYLASVS